MGEECEVMSCQVDGKAGPSARIAAPLLHQSRAHRPGLGGFGGMIVPIPTGCGDAFFDGAIQFAVGEFHCHPYRVLDGVGIRRTVAHDAHSLDASSGAPPYSE